VVELDPQLVGKGRQCASNKDYEAESVDEWEHHPLGGTTPFLHKGDKDLVVEKDAWVAVPRRPVASA